MSGYEIDGRSKRITHLADAEILRFALSQLEEMQSLTVAAERNVIQLAEVYRSLGVPLTSILDTLDVSEATYLRRAREFRPERERILETTVDSTTPLVGLQANEVAEFESSMFAAIDRAENAHGGHRHRPKTHGCSECAAETRARLHDPNGD